MHNVERATYVHCVQMAPNLRTEDVAEVHAATGDTAITALLESLRISTDAWTLCIDGEPCAMYGVAPNAASPGTGIVWLLGTEKLRKYPKTFWKVAKEELPKLLQSFPMLLNAVDSRYTKALSFAHRLGFKVGNPTQWGVDGAHFNMIRIERSF